MKYRIDIGDTSSRVALAICECGWRGLATTKAAAFERIVLHEQTMHPDDHNARSTMRSQRSRARRNATPSPEH